MKWCTHISAIAGGLLSLLAFAPLLTTTPAAAASPVACSSLAAYVAKSAGAALNKAPVSPNASLQPINSSTPVISGIVATSGPNLSYCQVVFQLTPAITIAVGLPLNTIDGGTGAGCSDVATGHGGYYTQTGAVNNKCVQGNWNGKIQAIGNGGFSGSVPAVTGATNLGFVGSSTDNGHSANWCNAVPATNNPKDQTNAQPYCGAAGAGFVLSPNNQLLDYQVTDFIDTSLVDQTTWAKTLAKQYYGVAQTRTYWNGCSTGGRQGMQMAQFHADMFDGILAGAPAFNWNRFQIGELWPLVVVSDVDPTDCGSTSPTGTPAACQASGVSAAFTNAYTAANGQAVADCDANDGVLDGVINEPRLCFFDAKSMIGQTIAPMTSPMTEAQALAIDMIWDGPTNQRGQRLWGGPTKGTQFGIVLSGASSSLMLGYLTQWMEQNPNYPYTTEATTKNFSSYFQLSDRKFADTEPPPPGFVVAAATDSTDLSALMANNTKMIHYRGLADPLIVPFNSWNYDTRLLERYSVSQLGKYYRSFYYPGNGHCGGNTASFIGGGNYPNAGLINSTDLLNALIDWVENQVPPASINAYTEFGDTGNTTLICPYPAYTSYNGSGPVTSASSYSCVHLQAENPDLAAYDQTATQYYEAP